MQENKLYEYAVIRIVPRVERQEFINAGILLFSKKQKYLNCRYELNEEKLRCLYAETDLAFIRQNLQSFEDIAHGRYNQSPIALLDMPERFRWLTATRSTVIQCSKVHPGLCIDEEETLQKLFDQYVS
ncbi:MAG TPA: DUF3037 domain-containing protein [Ferruginibacter sp.]|nr:DUF3037 domain-containing protein [Niastella sp.]HRB30520.1 DUF3037 domain-containing protein [Ferruginibacter sp.]